ncbi:SusC/RagA family TonB-linked outer membrane protein [Croceitalea vernalis]|uniref:TonB-dependent receptor n=1 Tax=Croceitalea vernalis TaxID=3075599 RepID=A0ABU3BJJ0_9FLAO|nr:TonB-dependent receptor [Croceitalea sp. P007]MDT0622320.1 TonB-dependent receptor [Croceitalea sp. P007]
MTKKTLKQFLGLAIALFSSVVFAQATQVAGTVSDADGPLPGVNIVVKGTTNGVTSDFDGNYSISNVDSQGVLIFSYIGYATQEISIEGRSTLNVTLQPDAEALNEVVIVGYGTSNKRELTGSVATIKKDAIVNVVASNPSAALQGKLSGVQIETPGGRPGGRSNFFIRGVNSLSNADPLFIVDGLFVDDMENIHARDIQNISVLKDASASAIYGSRAANGVVIVKTNHGQKNRDVEVTFDARIGFDSASKKLDYINGQQYTDFLNQRFANDGEATTVAFNGVNTDWQDENLKNGAVQDIGFSVSGGGENTSYFASGNYFSQEGILVGSGFKRINFRVNTRSEFGRLTLTQSLGITERKTQENNWFGWDGVSVPTLATTNSANEGGFEAPNQDIHGPGGVNQYGLASLEDNLITSRNIYGSAKLDYEIVDGLKASLNFGLDYTNTRFFQFTPTYFMSATDAVFNVNNENDLTDVSQNDVNILVEPTISYDKEFNQHKIGIVGGYTFFKENQQIGGLFGQGTPSNLIRNVGALPSSENNILIGADNIAGLESYFGRVNYGYDGKYLLSATLRRDASSRFAEENRVGYFPSFSAGWNISDEDFWNSEKINYFKLRASYGELGSYPDVFYPTSAVFLANQSNTSFGGGLVNGLAQTTLADPDLVWETTKTFDIGLDMAFLDNKMNLTVDYFSKDIEDVLVAINVPSTTGVSLPVTRNAGTLINQGLELEYGYRKTAGDFTFNANANIAFTLKSEAGDIPNPILGPAIDEDLRVVNRTSTGEAIGAYYGYVVEDKVNPTTGDFVRVDQNGDGLIDGDDIVNIGDPVPDFIYGINLNGAYKNFDFALAFTGVQGNEIYNVGRYYAILWQDGGKLTDVLNSWTPSNTDTNIPRASIADPAGNKAPSSFFVEDGSYFRLRNLDVGYNFRDGVGGFDWFKSLRLSVNIQNLFTISGYSGYDPDVASTDGGRANRNTGVPGFRTPVNPLLSRGVDARAYPNARTIMFGVQAKF